MEGTGRAKPTVTTGPTGINEVNPTVPTVTIGTTVRNKNLKLTQQEVQACDIGLSAYQDLIQRDFYAWYCKAWYILGRAKFDLLASMARADGKDPKKLFSYLLKKELRKPVENNFNLIEPGV